MNYTKGTRVKLKFYYGGHLAGTPAIIERVKDHHYELSIKYNLGDEPCRLNDSEVELTEEIINEYEIF